MEIDDIANRRELVDLVHERGVECSVEIGVYEGEFSNTILLRTGTTKHWLVDTFDGRAMRDVRKGRTDADDIIKVCQCRMVKFGSRVGWLRKDSVTAAKQFYDKAHDFIYIDAAHDYESVKSDLEAWWPKLKDGGVIAGHDYSNRTPHKEVKEAVDEFFQKLSLHVNNTNEKRGAKSWFVINE